MVALKLIKELKELNEKEDKVLCDLKKTLSDAPVLVRSLLSKLIDLNEEFYQVLCDLEVEIWEDVYRERGGERGGDESV